MVCVRHLASLTTRLPTCLTRNDGWSHDLNPSGVVNVCFTLIPRSSHSTSEAITSNGSHPVASLKPSHNSVTNGTHATLTAPEASLATSGLYAPTVKDPAQIKSPQLPFGENVAIATSVNAS